MSQVFDYRGKSVFVAGGTSGINLGIAEAFAAAGARIAVCSRKPDKVDAAVRHLSGFGVAACGYTLDVRDYTAVEQALAAAGRELSGIDVLVSGAAGNFPAPALGMSANAFKSVIDIDLLGTFHVLRAGFAHLNKPGACVINISAPQAQVPMTLQMHVCAAKAGVDMITRVAALEWGAAGVRVNSIMPGPIDDTEGMQRLAPTPQARKLTADSVPLGRFGSKSDIAQACLWLASPGAGYVTGAVIPVDGGWSLAGVSVAGAAMHKLFSPSKA